MDLFGKSPRPRFNDAMRSELAAKLGKSVFEWCNKGTPLADCIEDCEEILKWNINDEAFELAKEFESKGYSPDLELVEILDGVWFLQNDLVDKAEKRWVIEDDIQPKFVVGQRVIVLSGGKKVSGEISGIYPESAKYNVTVEGAKTNLIIRYEDTEQDTEKISTETLLVSE